MHRMVKQKSLDLNRFFETRQEIASNLNSRYAQSQVSNIRKNIQEEKLNSAKKEIKKEGK